MNAATTDFHPSIRQWFSRRFDSATAIQQHAWPIIAAGKHVLITAPTGSGKTLTAFLWSLNKFARGDWPLGKTRVLYISPLKALNNDIQRNLLQPLQELTEFSDFPHLQVRTRSGDTAQSERQRMLRKPPDILITTPESLANLLTTVRGRTALQDVETIIFDEVHSLVENRRGVSLLSSAERLVDLCGEIQRIALSATVNPLASVARYIGGYDQHGVARSVDIVNPPSEKKIKLTICYPPEVQAAAENGQSVWDPMAEHFRDVIDANRSTLFFTNSRAMAEKITLKINNQSPTLLAYAHHGSLAKEIRSEVERRLKDGELRAIVATSSLEMGIDIGALDLVVMLQSPPGIAATLQRLGRAGHSVGATSCGALFPVHAHDFLEAAALSRATQDKDLEPLTPIIAPLDVLAQIIISMCATEAWPVDRIYQLVKRTTAYNLLPREHFDLVLNMLAGRYAGARIRELEARLIYDRINGTVRAKKSALFALYNSGGTIPDRGYYQIRHADSGQKIGELDEEFVWEARIGDTFTLGTQHWQVKRITHNDVLVGHAKPGGIAPPFWRAERYNRSYHYSSRIGEFLQYAELKLATGEQNILASRICTQLHFDQPATEKLIDYLTRQRAATNTPLPHKQHLVVEFVAAGPGGYRGPDMQRQLILHSMWGGKVNQPWALALSSAWQKRYGERPEIHADNDAIIIQTKLEPDPAEVLSLVGPTAISLLLRESLEGSGFFGARFRECAGRFLLLTRQRFNQRLPLWMSRLQAKKIMSATSTLDDFPVMLETWRSCLNDEFELESLQDLLTDLTDGTIDWSYVRTPSPSPFAGNLAFDQINRYMYADDTPEQNRQSALSDDLIKTTVQDASLRPTVSAEICQQFTDKRQRLLPDYAPIDDIDWCEWVKERVLMPRAQLLAQWHDAPATLHSQLVQFNLNDDHHWICHRENAAAVQASGLLLGAHPTPAELPNVEDPRNGEMLALEILSFYAPLSETQITELMPGLCIANLNDRHLIQGQLLDSDAHHYCCDADNFEILLRWQRAARRPSFEPLPFQQLPSFLANWHHFNAPCSDAALGNAIDQLRAFTAPVQTLLSDLFAARLTNFMAHKLDSYFVENQLSWLGLGPRRCTLLYPEDIELLLSPATEAPRDATSAAPPLATLRSLFQDPDARFSHLKLTAMMNEGGLIESPEQANDHFWSEVWAGEITADSLTPLRQGMAKNFTHRHSGPQRAIRNRRRARFAPAAQWAGNWHLTPRGSNEEDALAQHETARERCHWLLDRYGCINKQLADREGGLLRWRHLFRALRVMELGGEVLQGLFFTELSGPQFITPRALTHLQQFDKPRKVFWCSSMDPISPCGMGLPWQDLPQRRGQNFLSFLDGDLALVVENLGRRLHFFIAADHADIELVLAVCIHIAQSRKKIQVETINGEPARRSPFVAPLSRVLKMRADHKSVYFEP